MERQPLELEIAEKIKELKEDIRRLQSMEMPDDLGLGDLDDPGADRILFWDASEGRLRWLIVGSGLTITDDTITAP